MHTVDEPGRVASGILALLVHLLFFGMLVIGISWQKKIVGPVVVDLWEELPEPVTKVSPPPPKIVETPPTPAPEVRKEPPPPPPPQVEAPPKPSPAEIELREKIRKQKEEEDAKRLEEKKTLEAEKRRLDEERRAEEETKRLEQEKLKREEETRRLEEQKQLEEQRRADELRREEERRERAATVERERQQHEAQRKQRDAEEAKRRAEAAARAAQQKLIDDWKARIQAKIKGRVVVPANIQGNPEARFDVVLLPGGEVLSATLRKSSGVAAYDAAVERAIMAAQPLPVPNETELFQENFRELALVFRPKD
jgi:colicin import membrane protein